MSNPIKRLPRWSSCAALAVLLVVTGGNALATIDGISGAAGAPVFNFTVMQDTVSSSDGNSHYAWGYADDATGQMQYPGPTLIVHQGDSVTINLRNAIPASAGVPVSIIFPGQQGVVATCNAASPAGTCADGVLTREVKNGGTVKYTFVANQPGTYMYQSGTNPSLQVDMGLIGAIVVRPNVAGQAYNQPGTAYDREHLFLLSEMDPAIHAAVYDQVAAGQPVAVDTTTFHPTIWYINGRNAPDTLQEAGVFWLPTQPYNALPRMHPGEKLLMRVANAGRDLHPFHHHANHALAIARDGRVLESAPGAGPDLGTPDFTVRAVPGQTMDLIFEWTGKGLGWDVYGHADATHSNLTGAACTTPTQPGESIEDHCKAIPVTIPSSLDLEFGPYYSGSPFLGSFGVLPPGFGGLNLDAAHFHMWHSHNEKEITTDNIFPGGMMTMLIIEPPGTTIP